MSMPQVMSLSQLFNNLNDKTISIYINELILLTKSINGRYICLDDLEGAKKEIENIITKIRTLRRVLKDDIEFVKLRLWLVEMINKLYIKDKEFISNIMYHYIGEVVLNIKEYTGKIEYDYMRDIETVALMYNALRVYEEIYKDPSYSIIAEDLSEHMTINFWNEQKRVLKRRLDDLEISPNIEMLYAISLSYSALSRDIKIKLLDTVFRELYTPYGLRSIAKSSSASNGLVFPKYMAHFIEANLNQNGSSYSSKKIAYNLVKDLLLDIGKYVQNTVKYVYSEKGFDIDYKILDLYTTSEMIRLYSMFM